MICYTSTSHDADMDDDYDLVELGARIKHARELKGLSQEDFGARVGRHRQTVIKWELGQAHPRNLLAQIREVLDLDVNLRPVGLEATPRAELRDMTPAQLMARQNRLLADLHAVAVEVQERVLAGDLEPGGGFRVDMRRGTVEESEDRRHRA